MSGYYNRNNRGITKKLGPVTAYADAVLAGYKGTREQWAQDMAKLGQNVTQVAQNTELTTELAEQTRENTEQVAKDTADVRRLADETSDNAVQVASNTAESNRLAKETKQAAAQAKADAEYAGAAADNFRVDTTLSEAGKAAEAKTTGEKFAQLSEDISDENKRAVARENEIEELFTMPTQEAVGKWLDEHPEATTTVPDHSLTVDKMVIGTLSYVTPEMFGAVGDGVTDDTDALQRAVNSASPVLCDNKYLITEPITLNGSKTVYGNGSVTMGCEPTGKKTVFYLTGRNNAVSGINIDGGTFCDGILFSHLSSYNKLEHLVIRKCINGFNCEESVFMCSFDRILVQSSNVAFNFNNNATKTSITLNVCECENCGNAYLFKNTTYSNLISCGADYCNMTTDNPYGDGGHGNQATANGVYNFDNCGGISINGCGCEYCYGNGAIYATASALVINGFNAIGIKSEFKPNFNNYPDYTCGYITSGAERNNIIVNGFTCNGFENTYLKTNYPDKIQPFYANNYSSNTYGKSDKYHVIIGGIRSAYGITNAGGVNGTGNVLSLADLIENLNTKKLTVNGAHHFGVYNLTSDVACNEIRIPFIANSNKNISHFLDLDIITNTDNDTAPKSYHVKTSFSTINKVNTPYVCYASDGVDVTASGLEVIIKIPTSYKDIRVNARVISQRSTLVDFENMRLAQGT